MSDLDTEIKKLEAEKLRLEIANIKNPPKRFTLSNAVTIVVALGSLAVAIAAFWLNNTIKDAASAQTRFENYSKLIDEFGKGGTAREGAIAGFFPFLRRDSPQSGQTVAILVNDLRSETDPVTLKAIGQALQAAGMDAYDDIREANGQAYDDFIQSTNDYVNAQLIDDFLRATPRTSPRWFHHVEKREASLIQDLSKNTMSYLSDTNYVSNRDSRTVKDDLDRMIDGARWMALSVLSFPGNISYPPRKTAPSALHRKRSAQKGDIHVAP